MTITSEKKPEADPWAPPPEVLAWKHASWQALRGIHPLAWVVMRMFDHLNIAVIDVTDVAGLLGAPSRPNKGAQAYRVVAADVLILMHRAGLLDQHGTVPRQPERGGHWYTLKGMEPR
jgi:hypothetical protein